MEWLPSSSSCRGICRELLSLFPQEGLSRSFCPPVTLCTPGSLVWSSLCSASPSDVTIQVFASSAPCWHHLGGFQLRSGPELSIKKDRVTHHLVKQPGVGTGTRNIQLLKKMISADGSDPAQLPITADHSSLRGRADGVNFGWEQQHLLTMALNFFLWCCCLVAPES